MREREHTYDADLDLVLPDLHVAKVVVSVSEPQELVTDAAYFDTPDRRLAAVAVTVRRQTGDHGAGWSWTCRPPWTRTTRTSCASPWTGRAHGAATLPHDAGRPGR